ncbi:DUF2867 domain-containing protein [Marilutibacter alkalisoli]|uniref:DUF2867 domain-containing protein n=1 Tax=Marilutibacter alkalisoli TaxID=2591633 RepID=UPI0031344ADE
MFADASARQRRHDTFVDALDEPSAKLAGTDLGKGDATSLYSFAVDGKGHPFHRHAGHRIFTAIAGSGGARLRFSTIDDRDLHSDPSNFARTLRQVDIPPDAMFTVRFGGGTWHQFAPLRENGLHPTLFALSCHTDELGGIDDPIVRERVIAGGADIPCLTELLPDRVADHLAAHPPQAGTIPTVRLSLHAPSGSWHDRMCATVRCGIGMVRRMAAGWRRSTGFLARLPHRHLVTHLAHAPGDSLLAGQLTERFDHDDTFTLAVDGVPAPSAGATDLLARVLEGFLTNRPAGVTGLMRLRNILVRPLRLRTSPLGCPASSLLSNDRTQLFVGRFPVLAQRMDLDGRRAQVILGADDRHLVFRSCVGVEIGDDGRIHVSLGTRVRCRNLFGRLYMALINGVHRHYISPAMLRMAVMHALPVPAGAETGAQLPA